MKVEEVKERCRGRWTEILESVAGIDRDLLDGRPHPCPRCGAGDDRFRCLDIDRGAVRCNQCRPKECGDGFSVIQWFCGCTFAEAVEMVQNYLGIGKARSDKVRARIEDNLVLHEFVPETAQLFCGARPPILPAALEAIGAVTATYRRQSCWAIPSKDPYGKVSGYVLYGLLGGPLAKYDPQRKVNSLEKCLLAAGSQGGLMLSPGTETAETIWKVEGPTDLLALLSVAPPGTGIITSSAGALHVQGWMASAFSSAKTILLVGDCDLPGQDGVERWAKLLTTVSGAEVKKVLLPFSISENHGKDLRDYLIDHLYDDLLKLAEQAPSEKKREPDPDDVLGDTDPHRLAKANLRRYAEKRSGATLKFWRDEWYKWVGTHYKKISDSELRAKVWASLVEILREDYHAIKGTKEETDHPKPVTKTMVSNVIDATAAITIVPESVEPGTWIEQESRQQTWLLSLTNGLLDIEAFFEDRECLLPHDPKYFSNVGFPYEFQPKAWPQRWLEFLNFAMEGDAERIAVLQEWCGYCLTPDCGHQAFLFLEGEGANGKSVFCAGLRALVGRENCSSLSLEHMAENFMMAGMLGKLVNISSDVGELDRIAEGNIKSLASGDVRTWNRKYCASLEAKATAKLVACFNQRPRVSDRSQGIWRRMLLCPFSVVVPVGQRVKGMDSDEFWSDERSGMLNWALLGLRRLRQQGQFSRSKVVDDAVGDYTEEANPARVFLTDHYQYVLHQSVTCRDVYRHYRQWCDDNGYRPFSDRHFGREVKRCFPLATRKRIGSGVDREYQYSGLCLIP